MITVGMTEVGRATVQRHMVTGEPILLFVTEGLLVPELMVILPPKVAYDLAAQLNAFFLKNPLQTPSSPKEN